MSNNKSGRLSGGRELTYIAQRDSYAESLFLRIINAINKLSDHTATSALGKIAPPHSINNIQVQGNYNAATNTITVSGELLHWTLQHNQSLRKGVHYFTEIATDSAFTQPHVIPHGPSRSGFVNLPTYLNDGSTHQTFYLRSYAQYPGSDPQKPTVLGGINGPTKIVMSGSTACTLLSSTGSGTASNGQQGGRGLGIDLVKPAPGPRRSVA